MNPRGIVATALQGSAVVLRACPRVRARVKYLPLNLPLHLTDVRQEPPIIQLRTCCTRRRQSGRRGS